MDTSDTTLVIGASQAGVQLAASLRELGDDRPITLVGGDARPPYQRPPLSKDLLTGATNVDSLSLRSPDFYRRAGIDLVTGAWVADLRVAPDGSGIAVTADGRELPFRRLALTTGGTPRLLDVPGAGRRGTCYLRDVEDAQALAGLLSSARRVVVVGGGFVGLEAAAAARAVGATVTVVELADRLLGRAVAPVVSDFYRRAHERRNTEVLLGAGVSALEGVGDAVRAVRLDDGRRLDADVVVVGVGMRPHTELAERAGLACREGIVVDAHARTSHPMVVAAGDCTVQPHPHGADPLRVESVQNAVSQARMAAATLAGADPTRADVPWFWSNQGDLKLQIAGLGAQDDEVVLRGDPSDESFSALHYRGDRLLGVDAVNSPRDFLAVRKALGDGTTLPRNRVSDGEIPLKDLLREAALAG